jgi:hypothetical protein
VFFDLAELVKMNGKMLKINLEGIARWNVRYSFLGSRGKG